MNKDSRRMSDSNLPLLLLLSLLLLLNYTHYMVDIVSLLSKENIHHSRLDFGYDLDLAEIDLSSSVRQTSYIDNK